MTLLSTVSLQQLSKWETIQKKKAFKGSNNIWCHTRQLSSTSATTDTHIQHALHLHMFQAAGLKRQMDAISWIYVIVYSSDGAEGFHKIWKLLFILAEL